MIHLLEDNKDEKTHNVTEELVLYLFLGVFVIFVVDSFAKVGKYTRVGLSITRTHLWDLIEKKQRSCGTFTLFAIIAGVLEHTYVQFLVVLFCAILVPTKSNSFYLL